MKHFYVLLPLLVLLSSCSTSQLVVNVQDAQGRAFDNYPIKIKFGEGISRTVFGSPIPLAPKSQEVVELGDGSYKVLTGSDGKVVMNYQFSERQPNQIRQLLGADPIPNRRIELTPLKHLPKGSKISITIPNP